MTPDDSVSPLSVIMSRAQCSDNTKSESAGSEGGWDRGMRPTNVRGHSMASVYCIWIN